MLHLAGFSAVALPLLSAACQLTQISFVDIITLSFTKLVTIETKHFGQEVPLQTALHQFEALFWKRFGKAPLVDELFNHLYCESQPFSCNLDPELRPL